LFERPKEASAHVEGRTRFALEMSKHMAQQDFEKQAQASALAAFAARSGPALVKLGGLGTQLLNAAKANPHMAGTIAGGVVGGAAGAVHGMSGQYGSLTRGLVEGAGGAALGAGAGHVGGRVAGKMTGGMGFGAAAKSVGQDLHGSAKAMKDSVANVFQKKKVPEAAAPLITAGQ